MVRPSSKIFRMITQKISGGIALEGKGFYVFFSKIDLQG
jgi:hypothetical protein